MVLVVLFLMEFILAEVSSLSIAESGPGGSATAGKTVNPVESPEDPVQKTVKSRVEPQVDTQEVIQPKQQMRPAAAQHFRNPRDGYEMILIPRGEAVFGTGPDDPYFKERSTDREKPQFRAVIPEFYMGIYCVTNDQYFKFVKETGHKPPDHATMETPIWKNGKFPKGKGKHPVVCVSWHDAKAYCDWAGLSLPTELQWEKAARGIDGRIYPWGNTWDAKKCRNYNNKGLETTCAVDGYPEGTSIFGMFNMSGNVWEWCEDWYESNAYERYARNDTTLPKTGQLKLVRGGSWHGSIPLPFRCAARIPTNPDDKVYWTGFRGVRNLEGR
jgi:formylglycine-generating enzyme required for sulfatase activity